MFKNKSTIQKLAFVYGFMFFAIVALNYVPGIHDEAGNMFGLFKLDPIDDALHLATAIWAFIAGWHSFRQSALYFKIFGVFYFTDGIVCMIFGQCIGDFTILTHIHDISLVNGASFMDRLPLNIPHMLIGALAIYLGFYFSKKVQERAQ